MDIHISRKSISLVGACTAGVIFFTWASITTDMMSSISFLPLGITNENGQHIIQGKLPLTFDVATHPPDEKCEKRLPGAIIVGIQKCGTTTLLRFLYEHPQIAVWKPVGEPKYFSSHYDKPLDWYRDMMPCSYSNQITMEKSPPYFYRPFCPERIRNMDPNIKIIIAVKDPIERAISMYAMLKETHPEIELAFEDFIMRNNRTEVKGTSRIVQFSNYPKHMKHWLDTFNMKQILIVDGGNLIADPSVELKKIETFLGIGSFFTAEHFVFNITKGKYCMKTPEGSTCMGSNLGRPHPVISTDVLMRLQKYFKPLNEQFFQMIGRRFEWGY